MAFNLGIDLTGGIATILDAFGKISAAVASFRQSQDADIRRRGDLIGLQIEEDSYYLWRNGLIQVGVPLPPRDQPPPLSATPPQAPFSPPAAAHTAFHAPLTPGA